MTTPPVYVTAAHCTTNSCGWMRRWTHTTLEGADLALEHSTQLVATHQAEHDAQERNARRKARRKARAIERLPRRGPVTWRGETRSIRAWSQVVGIGKGTILARLASGWSVDDALTTPAWGRR